MSIAISEYAVGLESSVKAFNARLRNGGITYKFPETCWDSEPDAAIVQRGFVAVQDQDQVRGGYLLTEQDFALLGERHRVGYIRLPLSEGLINPAYGPLAMQLLSHALRRQPLMFGLGIGGRDQTFARVVAALGWPLHEVPFYFRVIRPFRVARGLSHLRRTRGRRLLLDAAAWTGTAWLAGRAATAFTPRRVDPDYELVRYDSITNWMDNGWHDEVWNRCRGQFDLIAWRDSRHVMARYGGESPDYLRFRLMHRGQPIGWAVALATQMSGHRHFGDLRIGTIVDGMTDREHTPALVAAVTNHLAAQSVDMIVSNQSSRDWTAALEQSGYRAGPSNFLFAASPRLAKLLAPVADRLAAMHLTRGDGDGPINL